MRDNEFKLVYFNKAQLERGEISKICKIKKKNKGIISKELSENQLFYIFGKLFSDLFILNH